jgi:hypothetical protein
MKGPQATEEIENATPAIKKYGGRIKNVIITELATNLHHSIIVVQK